MICDLNVVYPQEDFKSPPSGKDLTKLKACLAVLEQLGYTHVALNFEPQWSTGSINKQIPTDIRLVNPINIERDFKEFEGRLKLYTRITLKVDDPSQCQNITRFQQVFDIVAVEPKTERALQLAITNLEIDIVTFDYQERLPCYLKHKTLCSAIDKGIHFEIKYSDILESNSHSRAQAISNIKQLIRASRSRGLVCSSGVSIPDIFRFRSSSDIANLLELIGLDHNRANQSFKDWSLQVLLSGRLRIKSYKQVVTVSEEGGLVDNKMENKDWNDTKNGSAVNIKMNVRSYLKVKKENAVDRVKRRRTE
ncbi:DEKNAAC104849 [Brettanomyces naardenensis]|uniref:DEKNAAC104849 n=1 Tax=Brettanomyces naardenensis TaxID=13370 RepID=A0A448YSA5_BRENA|nr:DEKNAAC104849 [Brettanomyces naardenensis]